MRRMPLAPLLLLFTCTASYSQTCESIQSQIDLKIKAAGVKNFTLKVVDAGIETTDKLTDPQIAAEVRRYFRKK